MKRKTLLFILLIALFAPLAMNGQQTFTIGTGTNYSTGASSNFTPGSVMGNTYNYYAITQTIYTASEISAQSGTSGAKTITSVAFYHNAYSFTSNITIYLAHTSNSTISGSSAITSGTANYTGSNITVGGSSAGWQTFTLDTPFEYDGTSNLLVVVVRSHSSGYKTSQGWQYTSTSSNYRHIVRSSDTAGYGTLSNGNSTYSYTQSYNRPNIQIGYTTSSSCASGCECFEDCTALTGTGSGSSGSTPTANLPTGWKGYGADFYPFAASFTSYMGNTADGQFMYFKATDSNATFLALPNQYVTEVNFDYAYETNSYGDVLFLEIGYMEDISSSTWYNNTFHSIKTMTNNGDTWGTETADFSSVSGTFYVVFKFSQTQGSWYSAAIDNVCVTTDTPDPCDKTIPYTYGFEDASDFNCWTTVDCEYDNQQGLSGIVDYLPHSGSNAFYISSYCGNTDPQYLISPKLRGVVNGVHVEFYYRNLQTAPETFQVGYSTTDNNVSSFTWVDSKECTATTYQHFTANYSGDVKYIAVKYTTADSYYLLLDDFTFTEVPSCLEPTNVTASNETTTSATISWTAGGSETEWDLYYTSNPSDVPGASTTPSISGITTTSQNLTSLNPATTYYVYVRAQCTEASAWSVPGIFNTDCEGMALPYFNGFEDGALSVCWTVINDNLVYMNADVADTEPYSGTYHLSLRRGTSNGNQIIVLPEVASNYALSNYVVSFYARLYASSSNETTTNRSLAVGVMTDPDDASTFVQVGSAVTPTSSYAQFTFDLSSYTGNGQYIAIKHTSTSNGHTFIDNIEVNALPCPVPAGLNASNITAASATLSWTGDQDSYNVRYRSYTQGEATTTTESFEGQTAAGYSATGALPNGWNSYSTNDYKPHVSNNNNYSFISNLSGNYLLMTTNGSATGSVYAIMPKYENLTAVSFYCAFESTSSCGTMEVGYVTDNTGYSTFQRLGDAIQPATSWNSDPYTLSSSDISTINSAGGYVAFKYNSNSTTYYSAAIDNVVVTTQSITYGEWVNKTNVATPLPIDDLTPTIENDNHYLPTNYQWQVQGVDTECSGGTTNWSAAATFTTREGFKKNIIGRTTGGYQLIASPIGQVAPANDVTNMTANSFDLYRYNANATLQWENYKQEGEHYHFNLEPGRGYLYANSETVDLVFMGAEYSEDELDVTLNAQSASGFKNWNLVGNPFAEIAHIQTEQGHTLNYYTVGVNKDGQTNQYIPATNTSIEAMQGVFVIAIEDEETITFARGESETKSSQLALNINSSRNLVDRAIVRFDECRQLPKFQLNEDYTKVYIPMDGEEYAVVHGEEMGELPVNFKAEENGHYSLNLSNENVEFAYLHLIDNLTGNEVDLLQTPNYSFEAKTTDYASRFKLVYATGDNSNSDNFAFFSNGSFVINNDGVAELQVVDIMGRILSSETINGCANVSVNAAPGVYTLRLINGTDVKVQKVVVK